MYDEARLALAEQKERSLAKNGDGKKDVCGDASESLAEVQGARHLDGLDLAPGAPNAEMLPAPTLLCKLQSPTPFDVRAHMLNVQAHFPPPIMLSLLATGPYLPQDRKNR